MNIDQWAPSISEWKAAAIAYLKSGRATKEEWNTVAIVLLKSSETSGLGALDEKIWPGINDNEAKEAGR